MKTRSFWKTRSITRRLIGSVLSIQFLSALGVIGATLEYERHVHFQAFDVMLRGRADSLLGSVEDADDKGDDVVLDRTHLKLAAEDVYQVVESDGRVLGTSPNWGGIPELRKAPLEGVFKSKIRGQEYRLICVRGSRTVDPLDAGGGTVHHITIVYGARTNGVREQIRQTVVFYAVTSCVLLIVTGALVMWVLRRGLLPLRELALEAEGISARRWSFAAPESARSTEELVPLVTALEAAIKRLEQTFEQQGRFISDAAHELKTAVAVLKSSLQVLTMRSRTAAEYEAGLGRSLTDLERMEDIVAKMLTLARFEHGVNAPAVKEPAELRECLGIVARQFEPMAELRGVEVCVTAPQTVYAHLGGDEAILLCSNLLINALQHSRAMGRVELTTGESGAEFVEISVKDDGEGITADVLPHVFERFYRGDPSRVRKTGGTGLGLAICRAIVQRAGGTIVMESVPGEGTKASVRLRRAEGPADAGYSGASAGELSSAWVNQTVPD